MRRLLYAVVAVVMFAAGAIIDHVFMQRRVESLAECHVQLSLRRGGAEAIEARVSRECETLASAATATAIERQFGR